MEASNKKRSRLVNAKPGPLALEARIMFDGAGVEGALAAKHGADALAKDVARAEQPAATFVPPAASAVSAASAVMQATQAMRDFLEAHPDDARLFALFDGGRDAPSPAWMEAMSALRQDIMSGRYSVQVREVSGAEIGGVFAAFAARGPDGTPAIFVNRDWLAAQPSAAAVNRILLEEIGHSLDAALNGNRDTRGDEGEAFAAAVLGLEPGAADRLRIAGEDDRSTILIDGRAYEVEEAAITFSGAYQGTPSSWSQEANQIANVAALAGSKFKFTSADPGTPYFSGNNVAGTLSYVDANGQTQTVSGVISRLFKTNGTVQGLFFYAWGNTTAIGDGGGGGDGAETAYLLVLDPTRFSAGGTYRTSSDPVDTALNRLIVPNSAPVAVNDSAAVTEDGTVSGNVLANDVDVNYDTLTITGFKIGATVGTLGQAQVIAGVGTLLLNSDGSYSFTAASGYTGPVPVVSYTVSDGQASASGNLTIAITPVNDAPAGAGKTVTLLEDYSHTFAASDFGFSDTGDTPANTLHSVKIATLPALGTLALNGVAVSAGQEIAAADLTKLTYTPAQNGNGAGYASFTFQVRDNGGTANGGSDTDPTPRTITFDVSAANDAPAANADTAAAGEAGGAGNGSAGTNPSGNVLTNDTDPDGGDTRTVASAASGAQGTTSVGAGTAIAGLYGTLTIGSDGSYTYTVDNDNATVQALRLASDTLSESFTYTVRDAAGLTSTGKLTVTLQGANDTLAANADFNLAVHSSTNAAAKVNPSGNVLTNDTEVDAGDTKTVTQASAGQTLAGSPTDIGSGTSVEGTEGRTYLSFQTQGAGNLKVGDAVSGTGVPAGTTVTAIANNSGTKTVTLSTRVALDWATLGTSTLTVDGSSYTIDARGAADANVIAISSASGAITGGMTVTGTGIQSGTTVSSVATVGGYTFVTLSNAVSGALGTDLAFGSSGTSIAGSYGTLVLQQDGTYSYTVTGSPAGTVYDYFTYKAQDASGAASTAVLKIEINVSNTTPPSAAADANAIAENSVSLSSDGSTNLLNNDSGASKSVTYAWAINDAAMTSVTGGGVDLAGLYGTLNVKSDGSYTYTPANGNATVDALKSGQSLTDQFRYRMTDSGGGAAIATLTITINGVNDAPAGAADTAAAIEAGGVGNAGAGYNPSGNVLANDSDTEGDGLAVSALDGGTVGQAKASSYGSLTLNADGSYSYT
ncbi:MAG TPA: Ig-like domain-containing protein, partial [Paucimonas sp.]|nr:Ig-like domain-containing protein [Paucimonas sp.]